MVVNLIRSHLRSRLSRTSRQPSLQNRRGKYTLEALEPRYVLDSTVVLNELMYHPRPEDGSEWIELHNQQGIDMDISGWHLDGGVQFTFSEGTIVPGSGYLIVAADPADVDVHGGTAALGPYTGRLANNGEAIQLRNNNDRVMDEIDYGDTFPWPVGPDGSGATLSKRNLNVTSEIPANWTTSTEIGGTPGEPNFPSDAVEFFTLDFHSRGENARIHIPDSNVLAKTWTTVDFVEGASGENWSDQTTGVGFFAGQRGEPYQDTVLTDNPLAYWRFGETNVADAASNLGTLGAAVNGAFDPDTGVGADSVVGDALDHSLLISDDETESPFVSPGFEKVGPDGRTTEFWVALEDEPSGEVPLVSDGEGALDFGLAVTLTEERRIRVRMKTDISFIGFSHYDGDRVLEVGEVVHVVANWSAATGESMLFLDGVEMAHINESGPVPNSGNAVSTDNPIFVGRDGRSSRNPSARVDEVAIYDYLLGADRVAAHFDAGKPTFSGLYQTELADMHQVGSSAYLRKTFELADNIEVTQLTLGMQYDDAFVAYVNGVEVARGNIEGDVDFDSTAAVSRNFEEARVPSIFELTDDIGLLRTGTNVLAVHGMNVAVSDEDFLLSPNLFALATEIPEPAGPNVAINEVSAATAPTFQIELQNDGHEPADLNGFVLVLDGDSPQEFTFASETIQPGALLSLTEADLGFRGSSGDHLFLYNGDRSVLIAARQVTNRLRGRSPQHDGRWLYPDRETPGSENVFAFHSDIIVNEIMYHAPIVRGTPDVEPGEQWIELYNRGDQAVDLTGWSFVDGINFDFEPGTVIGANQYLVVSNDAVSLKAKYPSVNVTGDFAGRIVHRGERLELSDEVGNPVDVVDFRDQGRWDVLADGRGSSLELRDPHADNSKPEAWQASDETDEGSWQTITYRGPVTGTFGPTRYHEMVLGLLDLGEVLLDDIRVIEDPDGEARQLIQNVTFQSDTLGGPAANWRIIGTHEQSHIVLDPDDPTNQVLKLVATGPAEHMHNHAETTLKFGEDLVNINNSKEYEISFRARWLAGSDLLNSRLYFNRLPRTTALAIPQQWGTPGGQNSRFTENIGPTYANLQHSPVVPVPDQFVTVTVAASDPDGIAAMDLLYTVNGGAATSIPMSIGDDGRYSAKIPGFQAGAIVQFWVEGQDVQGVVSAFPAAGSESRTLYVVDDGAGNDFGNHTFRIVMLTADADRLHEETNVMANARIGATVIYDSQQAYYDVGVRLKGSERGRNRDVRVGFNVQFDPLDLFRGAHQSIGIDRSGSGDEYSQEEILVKQTMNHAGGVTDLQDDIIDLIAPREEHTGSALLQMARYNDLFLDTQFTNGSDGALFKYELIYFPNTTIDGDPEGLKRPNPDSVMGVPVRHQGTKENHRWTFLNRNNPDRDDYSQLMNALEVMGKTGDEFHQQIGEVLDVDQWLRSFALQTLWGVGDNYATGAQHNGYFYIRPADGRMLFLPWDVDFTGTAGSRSSLVQNSDLSKLVSLAENKHFYYGHIQDIVATSFNNDYMDQWVDHYDTFLTRHSLQSFKNYIGTRSQHALDTINAEVPAIEFAVTTNDGQDLTTDQTQIVLDGTGWIDVREIRIAGGTTSLDVSWPAIDQWNVTLPLDAGQNNLVLEAYNLQGDLVGSDSIVITSTTTNPVVDSLRITEINYHPHDPTAGEIASDPQLEADSFEFIEFTNIGTETINPVGATFTNGIEFSFPSIEIAAGERVVLANSRSAFQLRYGTDVTPIGEFDSGRLSNAGETLTLVDGLGQIILEFSYGDDDPWPVLADGSGGTLEIIDGQNTPATEYGSFWRWHGSTSWGGSPGTPGAEPPGIVINEVLARTDPPIMQTDSIELLNTTDAVVDISGWYLSDARGNLLKFKIPAETSLGPGEYIVLDESDFNASLGVDPLDFALSGTAGDDVYLVIADDMDQVTTFVDDVHFGASPNGESQGRVPGYADGLAPLTTVTLGSANSQPRVGPMLISEVHYHPQPPTAAALAIDPSITVDELEFVEVHNPTGQAVDLTNWRLRGGIDFNFDDGALLGARDAVVIVPFNPAAAENADRLRAFRANYGLDDGTVVFGGYAGQLSDTGERIVLHRPDLPPPEDPTFIPRLTEDEIRYDNLAPWPVSAAGSGDSLQRLAMAGYGNLVTSWMGDAPSPGIHSVDTAGDFTGDGILDVEDINALFTAIRGGDPGAEFDLDDSGEVDQMDVQFLVENILGTFLGDANLDGRVDPADLNQVGIHWLAADVAGWQSGDFNGDGNVDPADLNLVGLNWLRGIAAATTATVKRIPRAPLNHNAASAPILEPEEVFNAEFATEVSNERRSESNPGEAVERMSSTHLSLVHGVLKNRREIRAWRSFDGNEARADTEWTLADEIFARIGRFDHVQNH